MHAGKRVDRDLLGVLLGILDLLKYEVFADLGNEHLVFSFLAAIDARFNEFS
ncbi:hypothetical protein D3C84_977400 [compost metagenome]